MKMKLILSLSILLVACVLSLFSMFIPVGTNESEVHTIGIQTLSGFPVPYRTTAPGLAWADFNIVAFGANTLTWVAVLALLTIWIMRRRNRGSSNKTNGA